MVLLGVILLLLGAGAGVVAYLATRAAAGPITVTAFGLSRAASPFELVLYGAVAMLLVALGWALMSAAARRRARLRREDKANARVTEAEEGAENARLEHERRFEEAGLRDEDLRRRENELAARHEGLDTREAELSRREAEWREREGLSRPDVAGGRAEGGGVREGTGSWTERHERERNERDEYGEHDQRDERHGYGERDERREHDERDPRDRRDSTP